MDHKLTENLNTANTKPLIKESLLMLNVCGISPESKGLWSNVKVISVFLLLIHFHTEIIVQFFFNWKGWESVEQFSICSALIQMKLKIGFMFLNKNGFPIILQHIEQFWSWDDLEDTFQSKIKYISDFTSKAMRAFFGSAMTAVAVYVLKPLFTADETLLPFDTYNPTNLTSPYYTSMYILQVFDVTIGCFCIIAFDNLFISFMIHIICELKYIKHRFSTIKVNLSVRGDDEKYLMEINNLIRHHTIALSCIKHLDGLYSSVVLTQFGSSITLIWSILLTIVAAGFPPDLEHSMKYVTFISAVGYQLLIYCLIGTLLTEETQSVSEAVYGCEWWLKTQPKLRKACVLIIQRAQKIDKLTAGGIFPLNLESFTIIVKGGLSFLTVAQGVYTRTTQK